MIKQFVSLGMVSVMVLSAVLLSVSTITSATHKDDAPHGRDESEAKIVICHATNSASNPYTSIEVDQSAADGLAGNSGQEADHYGEHNGPLASSEEVAEQLKVDKIDWGDIIPPIDDIHEGRNWTEAGQAIYNNDCNYVDPEVEPTVASVTYRIVAANCEAAASLFYTTTNAYRAETLSVEVPEELQLAQVVSPQVVTETEVTGPGTVNLLFISNEDAEFEDGTTFFVIDEELEAQLTGDQCVLGENPVDPTPETPVTPEVLPATSGAATAIVASIVAGLTALIALMGTSVRSLFGRSL